MPPDECRNEGTPSLGEGPDAWGETFGYFGAFAKVTRRKGETLSGRYRRNGYVPDQPTDWSADRPPSRASSLPHSKRVHPQKPGRFPTMKPAFSPLLQRHSRLTSTKRKICPNPPQVEGPNNRHSTNRQTLLTTAFQPSYGQNPM
jgi:hypothetical protein